MFHVTKRESNKEQFHGDFFFLTFGMLLSFMSQSMLAVEDEELLEHILIINNEKKHKNDLRI